MADIVFTLNGVPNTYRAQVQRAAVLSPLARRPSHRAGDIRYWSLRFQRWWRMRLWQWAEYGFTPGKNIRDIQYVRNCVPAFVISDPITTQCNLRHVCPFCYARQVGELWTKVDAVAVHQPFDIVEQRYTFHFPYDVPENLEIQARNLLLLAKDLRSQAVVPAADGAIVAVTVEPSSKGWKLRQRGLYAMPPGLKFPGIVLERDLADRAKQTELSRHSRTRLSRRVILHAVARTCRYPVGLMRSHPMYTAALLCARRLQGRLRLLATSGVFYD